MGLGLYGSGLFNPWDIFLSQGFFITISFYYFEGELVLIIGWGYTQ
jgi:hypothetical protein